jgi:hypothetical protein
VSELDSVASPTIQALGDGYKLQMIRALLGGTAAMRLAGTAYLPREAAESELSYQQRLNRSFLFNGYAKTVRDMTSKVFSVPIVIGEDVPQTLAEWLENVDLSGQNLDVFANQAFFDSLNEGIGYILTDMTPAPATNGRPLTQAETAGRRPWMAYIPRSRVLGWRREIMEGHETLTQFRYRDDTEEPDGLWGTKIVPQVRVYNRDGSNVTWQLYRKDNKGNWSLHEEGTVTIGVIPVAPIYINRTGFFDGAPPLADLAEINVAHWQSQSDQRTILHVARVPILFGSGMPVDGAPIEIGAGRMVRSEKPDGRLVYVEHTGAAINSGRQDLKDLEFQMQTMGLELLIPKPGGQTATGEAIDQARMNTPLAFMALALQDALEASLAHMAAFGELGDDGGSLNVNTDFGISPDSANDMKTLFDAVNVKAITRTTYVSELKRRRILSADVDPALEVAAAASEDFEDDAEEPMQGTTQEPAEVLPDNADA